MSFSYLLSFGPGRGAPLRHSRAFAHLTGQQVPERTPSLVPGRRYRGSSTTCPRANVQVFPTLGNVNASKNHPVLMRLPATARKCACVFTQRTPVPGTAGCRAGAVLGSGVAKFPPGGACQRAFPQRVREACVPPSLGQRSVPSRTCEDQFWILPFRELSVPSLPHFPPGILVL